MAIMYLSKENLTCPKEQISLYLSVLKHFTLFENSIKPDVCFCLFDLILYINSSAGFFRREIYDIEHNKGSKIYPQNRVILDCIMSSIPLKHKCLSIILIWVIVSHT